MPLACFDANDKFQHITQHAKACPYAMALLFWEIWHSLLPINHNFHVFGNEEKDYAKYPLPKFYKFPSVEAKERILYANFLKINKEVKDMISEIQKFNTK